MGANLKTLIALLRQYGPGRYPVHMAIILGAALARSPFSAYERWQVARTSVPTIDTASNKSPIFIVGHWRSGTTFLHSVLCQSQQFAYTSPLAVGLPWDFLTLGKGLRPLLEQALPKDRFIDSVPVNPDSPQEDEIALASMQTLSFYHGLYFPQHFIENFNAGIFFEGCDESDIEGWQQAMVLFCQKLQLQNPGQQLLIKNPVYTARVQTLRQIWPDAKFIHIYRNPYIVFQSTLNFYVKLFRELSLQPFESVPVEEIVLESYPKMIEKLFEDTADLPEKDFIEIQFEAFEATPIEHLSRIYRQLEIEGWEEDLPAFERYLASQKSYQKNRYAFDDKMMDRVGDRWRPLLDKWGYEPPGSP